MCSIGGPVVLQLLRHCMSYIGSWGSDVVFEAMEEDPTDFSLFLSFSPEYMQHISSMEFACAQA